MAISLKTSGAWVQNLGATGDGDITATLVGTPAAGDRYFLWVCYKDFSHTVAVANWTEITEFADGSVAAASGVGSMKIACYYRDWQSGDTNPVIDVTGVWDTGASAGDIMEYVMQLWQKDAGEVWDTPAFVTAAWPATSTTQTVNASSTVTVPSNSVVMCGLTLRDDSATFTRATDAIKATSGVTWNGNHVESPDTHVSTTNRADMAADLGHRFVTTGGAGITLQVSATISAVETGSSLWVVQGVSTPSPAPDYVLTGAQLTGANSATANVPVPAGVAAGDLIMIAMKMEDAQSVTPPTDFVAAAGSPVVVSGSNLMNGHVFWKRATGADSGTYDMTFTGTPFRSAVAFKIVDEVESGSPFDVTNTAAKTTTTDGTTPSVSVTTTGSDRLVVWIGFAFAAGVCTTLTGYNEKYDPGAGGVVIDVATQASAGSTGSLSATFANNGSTAAWLGAVLPVASGESLSFTETDNVGLTDSLIIEAGRTQADPVGITDTAVIQQDWVREQTDLVALTDILNKDVGQAYVDPVGLTDTATFVLGFNPSATDTVGIVDSLITDVGRTQTDPVGIADVLDVSQNWVRDQADPIGIADTAEFAIILVADGVDPVGVTDTLTVVADYIRIQTDPVDIIDVFITDAGRTQVDSIGIADSAEFAISLSVDATDTIGVTDSLITDAGRTQTDPVAVSDTIDVTQGWVHTQTDAVAITDSAEVIISLIIDATDPVGATDTSTVTADYVRTETDPVDLADTLSLGRELTATDLIGVTDTATFEISLAVDTTDSVDTTDAATFLAGYVRAFTDPIGITDTATFALGALEAAEPIGITDTAQFYPWVSTERMTLVAAGERSTVAAVDARTTYPSDDRSTLVELER